MPARTTSHTNHAANQLHQQEAKSQTLPCFSMVATGGCSYECYCKYIHDDRLLVDERFGAKSGRLPRSNERRNTTEKGFVLFYWPPVQKITNENGKQHYDICQTGAKPASKNYSYLCLVSMWTHYLDVIADVNAGVVPTEEEASAEYNPITKRKRLPIFRELATTKEVEEVPQMLQYCNAEFSCSNSSQASDTSHEELSDCDSEYGIHACSEYKTFPDFSFSPSFESKFKEVSHFSRKSNMLLM